MNFINNLTWMGLLQSYGMAAAEKQSESGAGRSSPRTSKNADW